MTYEQLLKELDERTRDAQEGGGLARQARQTRLGRLNARERIAQLVDQGSFEEFGKFAKSRRTESARKAANRTAGDGLVCGLATVEGQNVVVYAHDPTVLRGALGHAGAMKLCRLLDLAKERRFPVLSLVDCEGVRVEEGIDALESVGGVIERTIALQGLVPQLTLVNGLCVGVAAYVAVLTDAVAMVKDQTFMFVTGGKVTRVVTGESSDIDELGGPLLHSKTTGSAHAVVEDEAAGIAWLKRVLKAVSKAHGAPVPLGETKALEALIPVDHRKPYDARAVLSTLFDEGSVLELSPDFAPNLLTAFARLGGRPVGVVASQPMALAGCLDVRASRKGAAFVRWVHTLGLPLVTLVDVPGYLPGQNQEASGILAHGAELLVAYAKARIPKIAVVLRKSYGGASVLSFAADLRLALPTARVDPMGPEATLEVILGPQVPDAPESEKKEREARRAAWLASHDTAWSPAEDGYLDRIVAPAQLRQELGRALARLST